MYRAFKYKVHTKKFSWWEKLTGPKCPECGKKMKRVESPYEAFWNCPGCGTLLLG